MQALLALARGIDALNERVGRASMWLVLVATLVSAGNALVRYGLDNSSNAWLEIQWYLFAMIFLFGAGYTLKHNGHVRIDVLYGRLGPRAQAWIDLFGALLFLAPLSVLMVWMGWEFFQASFAIREGSPDSGGLARWPIKLVIPLGFALLLLQAVAEIIKRIAVLRGWIAMPAEHAEETV